MRFPGRLALSFVAIALAVWTMGAGDGAVTAAGPQKTEGAGQAGAGQAGANQPYRALAPIESGNLLLFPVVRSEGKPPAETPFITLDEGIGSGEVEVTEAGRAAGLVRPRGRSPQPEIYAGDEVNTLVLVNHARKPLLLLAGEIVTGGKQDRIVARDRIVPPDADPIDLSVFCIEPGRWTESSPEFGASAKTPKRSFMVQPAVRERAMVDRNQQQVWASVHGAIAQMEAAAAPSAAGLAPVPQSFSTTSYAKVMENSAVSEKVDEAAPVIAAREQVLARLREEKAIGVVVAVRGEIVWADLFADTDLLARYWTKLVRSYAAESLTDHGDHAAPTAADAQRFLAAPAGGTETSVGEVGVYRYSEMKSGGTETFVLQSLLPGAQYAVHTSKMKIEEEEQPARRIHPMPMFRPEIFRPAEPPEYRPLPMPQS